jgi:hypothetical protein
MSRQHTHAKPLRAACMKPRGHALSSVRKRSSPTAACESSMRRPGTLTTNRRKEGYACSVPSPPAGGCTVNARVSPACHSGWSKLGCGRGGAQVSERRQRDGTRTATGGARTAGLQCASRRRRCCPVAQTPPGRPWPPSAPRSSRCAARTQHAVSPRRDGPPAPARAAAPAAPPRAAACVHRTRACARARLREYCSTVCGEGNVYVSVWPAAGDFDSQKVALLPSNACAAVCACQSPLEVAPSGSAAAAGAASSAAAASEHAAASSRARGRARGGGMAAAGRVARRGCGARRAVRAHAAPRGGAQQAPPATGLRRDSVVSGHREAPPGWWSTGPRSMHRSSCRRCLRHQKERRAEPAADAPVHMRKSATVTTARTRRCPASPPLLPQGIPNCASAAGGTPARSCAHSAATQSHMLRCTPPCNAAAAAARRRHRGRWRQAAILLRWRAGTAGKRGAQKVRPKARPPPPSGPRLVSSSACAPRRA